MYCHCRYVGQDDEGTRGWKSASRVKKCTPVLKFEIQVPLSESPSEPSHWLTWQQCSGTHNSLEIVLLVICCTRERPSSYYIHQKPRALLNRFHQQLCTRQCQFVRHMPTFGSSCLSPMRIIACLASVNLLSPFNPLQDPETLV